jgi:predicted DNA helicase
METALKVVPQREEWIELLLGLQAPAFDDPTGIDIAFYNEQLNASQQEAVRKALAARQAFMLHGPPGTGKTTTLVELIRQEVERASFILAATDSNVAVDNLVEKLARAGLKVLRMGHPARVNENLIEYALDHVIMDHPSFMQAQQYYREIDRMKEDQQEYDRPTGQNRRGLTDKQILDAAKKRQSPRGIPADKLQSMARWLRLQRRINDYFDQAKALTQEATVDLLADTQVVCATHATAGSEVLRDGLFYANRRVDLVVVDEASQAMEPTSLISLVYGRRFVMAGDDRQLPPTVLSDRARPVLQLTLFERLRQCYDPGISHMLRIQYRMHEAIMAFSNERFYGGKLAAHPSVKRHTLAGLLPQGGTPEVPLGETLEQAVAPEHPVVFLDTETMDEPWEQQRPGAFSRENLAEVALVSEVFAALQVMGLETHQVGIISPYDHQVDRLKGRLGGDERLEIKTVDGFQGREKEAIVLSLVRANETGEIGFLKDLRRLNVAVTRARRKLIIIGHGPTLRQHEAYDALLGRALSLSGRAIRTGAAVG